MERIIPAPILSPSRLIKILPISLFAANDSRGIAFAGAPIGPRRLICTSAEEFFVNTLSKFRTRSSAMQNGSTGESA